MGQVCLIGRTRSFLKWFVDEGNARLFLSFIFGGPFRHLVSRLAFFNNRKSWAEFIRGKSVCVVGPAPVSGDFGQVVESHDVVIRVGAEHWPWLGTGSRTDVWVLDGAGTRQYINHSGKRPRPANQRPPTEHNREQEQSKAVQKTISSLEKSRVPWIIFKGGTKISASELVQFSFARNVGEFSQRVIFSRKPSLLTLRGLSSKTAFTHLNQVPLVLLELSLLQPRLVSVFGSDYYSRPGRAYGKDSPSFELQKNQGELFIEEMLSSHNQLQQREIVRWVQKKRGWLSGGKDFLELTEMETGLFLDLFSAWRPEK